MKSYISNTDFIISKLSEHETVFSEYLVTSLWNQWLLEPSLRHTFIGIWGMPCDQMNWTHCFSSEALKKFLQRHWRNQRHWRRNFCSTVVCCVTHVLPSLQWVQGEINTSSGPLLQLVTGMSCSHLCKNHLILGYNHRETFLPGSFPRIIIPLGLNCSSVSLWMQVCIPLNSDQHL